jgi:hypothetical protein
MWGMTRCTKWGCINTYLRSQVCSIHFLAYKTSSHQVAWWRYRQVDNRCPHYRCVAHLIRRSTVWNRRGARPPSTTRNLNTSVCAKTYRKMRIPTEKYFSDGVPLENNTQKWNDRKIEFFYRFAVRNSFSVGLTHTEKLRSPRLKIIFLCGYPYRKKGINAQKNVFFWRFRRTHRKISFAHIKHNHLMIRSFVLKQH